jgi:hypothetical protein
MKSHIEDNTYQVVTPDEATQMGMNYSRLARDWWEHVSSLELYENPLMDDGTYQNENICLEKQSGHIINIGSTLGNLYRLPITRQCKIPSDKYCLFAILNCATNEIEHPELKTLANLEAFTKNFVDSGHDIVFTINGQKTNYFRTQSREISFKYSRCGVYAAFGISNGNAKGVQNGFYSLVQFGKGMYKIRISAKARFPEHDIAISYVKAGQFATDVIYNLNIV